MKKTTLLTLALGLVLSLLAGLAHAKFAPKFSVKLTSTKIKQATGLDFHLEFAADDEEIGNFKATLPKGFNVASDQAITEDTDIGGGEITIQAGPACANPSIPDAASAPVPVSAEFLEKDRTDAEQDAGVHSVWFLNLEPLNRVRLLVTGSKAKGWTIEGAPTPSAATCNPLIVDLTIVAKTASGTSVVTAAPKAGKYRFTAEIASQDSPDIVRFRQIVKLTK